MISIASFRQTHACEENECIQCAGVSAVLYECRHCGTETSGDAVACPECGRREIVQYTF